MIKVLTFVFAWLLFAPSPVMAEQSSSSSSSSSTPTLRERIKNGEKNGSLTDQELKLLNQKQKQLSNFRERMDKDGKRTDEEKAKMKELREEQRKRIQSEKNDAQMQYDQRMGNFVVRIQNGVKEGTITEAEAAELTKELEKAQEYYKSAIKDDGKVDKAEREALSVLLNPLSKEIREEREDAQKQVAKPDEAEFFCGSLTDDECLELQELQKKYRQGQSSSQ